MPVGSGLAARIKEIASENYARPHSDSSLILGALARSGGWEDHHRDALIRLRDGVLTRDSIDDFLADWQGVPDLARVAKLCIAQAIIEAEGNTHLGPYMRSEETAGETIQHLRGCWLDRIVRYFNGPVNRFRLESVLQESVFIVFNYDRCIEAYFYAYLTGANRLTHEQALQAMGAIKVIHVYGAISPMPQLGGHQPFGEVEPAFLSIAAADLKTYSESLDSDVTSQIAEALRDADKVIFLGCAFHQQNLRLLFPQGVPEASYWATGYGLRATQVDRLKEMLANEQHGIRNAVTVIGTTASKMLEVEHDHLFS